MLSTVPIRFSPEASSGPATSCSAPSSERPSTSRSRRAPPTSSTSWSWIFAATSAPTEENAQVSVSDAPPLEVMSHRGVQDLVERIRSGDSHAFEEIIRLHERRVLAMAIQMGLSPQDAQDVCQEVFLRVFRYLSGFRAGLVFEAWLCRIAVHVIYDALRYQRDRGEISWEGVFGPKGETSAQTAGLHLSVENADLCGKLLARMQVLTPQERMVFVLRDLQDLDT